MILFFHHQSIPTVHTCTATSYVAAVPAKNRRAISTPDRPEFVNGVPLRRLDLGTILLQFLEEVGGITNPNAHSHSP